MRLISILCATWIALAPGPAAAQYIGELVLKPLPDGRKMEVIKEFGFKDKMERSWIVPAGWVVDGASIPSYLWSIIGGPFSGKYRDASVVHDYFCDMKRRPWQQVHEVFHEAMLHSGVSKTLAKTMYLAVYRFGPRWDFSVTPCGYGSACNVPVYYKVEHFQPAFVEAEFEALKKRIETNPDAPIDEIKTSLDIAFIRDALRNAKLEK